MKSETSYSSRAQKDDLFEEEKGVWRSLDGQVGAIPTHREAAVSAQPAANVTVSHGTKNGRHVLICATGAAHGMGGTLRCRKFNYRQLILG